MIYEKTVVPGDVNILANDHYVGKPMTLNFADVTGGVVKAGTPMAATGVAANDATAIGVLLSDVYAQRPIGTVVIHGFIDSKKAQTHSGVTVAATAKTALPLVAFL